MNLDSTIPLIAGTILVTVLVVFIILFVILYKKAQLKFELERQEFQQALLQTEVEIREQTLSNISRDLHDNFGQIASLVKIHLAMISKTELKEEDRTRVEESVELVRDLIKEIRSLSTSLNSQNLAELGIVSMIENDISRIKRTGFIDIQLHYKPVHISIDPQKAIFLYRMFQEMINNILKHSEATKASVGIESSAGTLTLKVNDNGKGMPKQKLKNDQKGVFGNGLLNIKERCKIIGATYSIESYPNKGTFIEIKLPTNPQ